MTLLKDDTQMIIDKLEQADNLLQECRLRLLDCWCNYGACYIGKIQERLEAAIRHYKKHLRTAAEE